MNNMRITHVVCSSGIELSSDGEMAKCRTSQGDQSGDMMEVSEGCWRRLGLKGVAKAYRGQYDRESCIIL